MDNKKKLIREARYAIDPEKAALEEMQQMNDRLETIESSFGSSFKLEMKEPIRLAADPSLLALVAALPQRGPDGHTPELGVDYLTEEDMQTIKEEVTPVKGVDYFTPDEIRLVTEEATPVKGVDYFTQADIKEIALKVKPAKGDKGEKGDPGELSDVDVEAVVEQLKKLKGDKRIPLNAIRGAENINLANGGFNMADQRWHGGGGGGLTVVSHDATLTGDGTLLNPLSVIGGGATWTPQGITTSAVGGIPAGTDLGVVPVSIETTLRAMFYPYIGPSVTLATIPGGGIREFGNTSASVVLNATTVRNTNPITSVTFFRNAGLINTVVGPNPAGGLQTYTDNTLLATTTTYFARVGDGTQTNQSNTVTFTFVYPFYYGVGAPGASGATVGAMTKIIQQQQNTTRAFAPVAQVYYFAYPAAYPNLTAIFDGNGFNITADWTLRNPVVITGLDSTPQNYKVYEFNNINSVSQNLTFNF